MTGVPSDAPLSPDSPYLVLEEQEPSGTGEPISAVTIFLTASRCPVGCRMCDLHRYTLTGPTSRGAIPKQLDEGLRGRPRRGWLKLYNSGNFFDPQSIPVDDYPAIASRCEGFSRVVVENHPKLGGQRLRQFRDLLPMRLEVAVGLETVQPRWLQRMAKQMTRDDFDRYARWLAEQGVDLRVFLIIGVPGVSISEAIRWTRLSVRHAIAAGARHISLIPARPGEGWDGQADSLPKLSSQTLAELQQMVLRDVDGGASITIDLWMLDPSDPLFDDLHRRNLHQRAD